MESNSKIVIENVSDELKRKFKSKCAIKEKTMSELIIRWIEEYVGDFNDNL